MKLLTEGLLFKKPNGELLRVAEVTPAVEQIVLKNQHGFTEVKSIEEITRLITNDQLIHVDEGKKEEAMAPAQVILAEPQKRRLLFKKWVTDYIISLRKAGLTIHEAMNKARQKHHEEKKAIKQGAENEREKDSLDIPQSDRQLHRWIQEARSTQPSVAMAPKKRGWRRGKTRTSVYAVIALKNAIEELGKQAETQSIESFRQQINKQLEALCKKNNVEYVRLGRKKIKELLTREIPWSKKLKKWLAPSAYRALTRVAKQLHQADRILEVVEIDALTPDLHVCDEDGVILGAPTIYAMIDVGSGMIIGIYAYLVKPGSEPLMHFCSVAFFEKEPRNGKVLPHGVPEKVVSDQGPEFKSEFWMTVLLAIGAIGVYAEGEAGWKKPHIERFFGELQQRLLWRIAGSTHSEVQKKNDQTLPERTGALTVKQLNEQLQKFAYDIYPDIVSEALCLKFNEEGMTPRKAWDRLAKEYPPVIPLSRKEFLNSTYQYVAEVSLRHSGVTVEHAEYNSDELADLYRSVGPVKVSAYRSPIDVGVVMLKHIASQKTVTAKAKVNALHGMTGTMWKRMCDRLLIGKGKPNEAEIDDALAELIRESNGLAKKTRLKDRRQSAKAAASMANAQELQEQRDLDVDVNDAKAGSKKLSKRKHELIDQSTGEIVEATAMPQPTSTSARKTTIVRLDTPKE